MRSFSTPRPCWTPRCNCAKPSGTPRRLAAGRQHARIAEGDEGAVDQAFAAVVAQPVSLHPRDVAAGGFEHRLSRGRIPFRSRAETRIELRLAIGEQTEFQRAADSGERMRTHA